MGCVISKICLSVQGTHWMENLVYFIRSSEPINSKASYNHYLLEMAPRFILESLASPRNLATHLNYDRLPTNYLANGGKIIFVLRNPKDVAVSLWYFLRSASGTKISWDTYVTCFLNGIGVYV